MRSCRLCKRLLVRNSCSDMAPANVDFGLNCTIRRLRVVDPLTEKLRLLASSLFLVTGCAKV